MKRGTGLFILGLGLSIMIGCTFTLNQLRNVEPQIKMIRKDAYCVYQKLSYNAISCQTGPLLAKMTWLSAWDPTEKHGLIYAMREGYGVFVMMFDIYDIGGGTKVEMRTWPDCSPFEKKISDWLWKNMDFSGCPDKRVGQ